MEKEQQGVFSPDASFQRVHVGHYTSPPIFLKFNERIWFDGNDVCDDVLEEAHTFLLTLLNKDEQKHCLILNTQRF